MTLIILLDNNNSIIITNKLLEAPVSSAEFPSAAGRGRKLRRNQHRFFLLFLFNYEPKLFLANNNSIIISNNVLVDPSSAVDIPFAASTLEPSLHGNMGKKSIGPWCCPTKLRTPTGIEGIIFRPPSMRIRKIFLSTPARTLRSLGSKMQLLMVATPVALCLPKHQIKDKGLEIYLEGILLLRSPFPSSLLLALSGTMSFLDRAKN